MTKEVVRIAENSPLFGDGKVFETFRYSPAIKAGGLVFIAGQVGLRRDGTIPEDVSLEAELAFQRVGELLECCGLGFEALVELVSYHVDIDQHLAAFRAVKDRFIIAPYPTWTIVGVAALARPALKVEIKCVAAL
jgi:enamine deaminase RidA (YjgF/YER057c/UK114 family)